MTASRAAAPIGPADRVIDVLARDERLVEVFIRHAPHFEKLRSPAMRRVMARLVTVEQAARMAGVAADVLVRDLNVALLGERVARDASAPSHGAESSSLPGVAHRPAALRVVELDVRDDLRAGREPFSRILATVNALEDDQGLRLRTIFEPVPLFALLAKRGFLHESRRDAPDDWSAWFWRASARHDGGVQIPRLAALARDDTHVQIPRLAPLARDDSGCAPLARDDGAHAAADDERGEHEVWLDVRGLEPPQPMLRTLAALETLPEGQVLVQINVRVPQLLLPVLAERGYACELDESRTDRVLLRIWRSEYH